jgi:exodeoxyribonuclease-3
MRSILSYPNPENEPPVRIVTLNVNGIRSASSKGFLDWMKRQRADFVCIQEIKAHEADLSREILAPARRHAFFHPAEKRGYSGVAIYARKEPDRAVLGLGIPDIDAQGRYLQLDYGKLSVVSLYVPSGSSGEEAQARKFAFMKRFMPKLEAMKASGREFIVCGDWNIAHKEIDLKNWRSNQKNSGFLPEERAWLTDVFDKVG